MILLNQPHQFNKQQREKGINPMKRTIERITRAAMLAVAFMLCATGQVWADPVLTMSGYVSVDSENPSVAFTGVTLNELMSKYKLSGDMGGGHALPVGAATACVAKLNDGALTVQFQRIDRGYCKCVYVKFTEDTSVSPTQIKAVATSAKYANYASKFGTDADGFANPTTTVDNDSDGGYGICDLALTPREYSADTININFTHDSSNLTTLVEQGLAAYAVSGILWDNMSGGNGSLATVHKTASDGTYSTVDGASIAVSGALGSYRCNNLTAENDLRHGYVDDQSSSVYAIPQVDIAGIPFDSYRVVVYHACEAANTAFGYDTIGGVNYKVANGVTIVASGTDTDTWGDAGAKDSAEAIAVGVNCLVTPAINGSSLTIVGHCLSSGRTGIAAIQIVKVDAPSATYSASINSNTAWSNVSWADSKTWSNDGDAIATISVANSPTLTFDESVTACGIFLESDAGGITLAGTKPTAGIDYSGIAGEVTYGFLCSDPIYSRTGGLKLTGGAGTSESAVAFTPAGGSITFDGSGYAPYYLSFNNSATSTTINFNDAEVHTSSFDLGTATAIVGGASDITATRVILSQGDNSRTASLTVKDSAKLTVTGTTNADQNTASIMFGHWNGPSTFTLQDSAEFSSPYAYVLVGRTGNAQTINIDGGLFSVKGIFLSEQAYLNSGVDRLNISGGELRLGNTGITSNSGSSTMPVSVTDDAKISTMTSSTEVPITQAVTVSANKTLTLDGGGTITFTSLTLNAGSSLVLANGTKAVINGGSIDDTATINVGVGTINIKQLRPNAEFTFASGGRLEMTEVTSESGTTTLNVANETMPDITLYDASGNVLAGVIPSISGTTLTIVATGGQACWMDYEFNGNGNSIGTDTTGLSASSFYDGQAMYIYNTPWRDVNKNSGGWGNEWSAVTRFTNPEIGKTVIITFGNQSGYVGFVSGGKGSVKFVAHSSGGTKEELCTLDISSDPLAPHVYAIKKTASSVAVYLDGTQKYSNDSKTITINQGMQIGSMHGGVADSYYNAGANLYEVDGTPARMDFLRVYQGTISDSAISAIASEFSGMPTYTAQVVSATTLDFGDLEWYEGLSKKAGWPNDYKTKMMVSVADDVTLSLPETIRAYDITFVVSSGKTLTLQCAGNGSSLLTEAGVTIGYTQGVEQYSGTVKIEGSLSAGPISKGADDVTLDTAEGSVLNALGSVDVNVTGAGTIVYNRFLPKSGSGTSWTDSTKWTGTVWVKNRTIAGIQLNNYGNAESTVKLTAFSGYFAECTDGKYYTINPAIEVEGSGLDIQNGWKADRLTIRELKGTGTFKSSGGGEGVFHIKKIDNFAGEWNTSKRLFYIGDDTFNVTSATTGDRNGTTILKCDASIPSGKTWTIGTSGYIKIEDGVTLSVAGTLSGKVTGSGTIDYATIGATANAPTFQNTWTGMVIVPYAEGSMTVNLHTLGVAGSKIKVMGFKGSSTANSVKIGASAIAATVELADNVRLQTGDDDTTYSFAELTGTGDFAATLTGTGASTANMRCIYSFTKLTDYTGTLSTVTVHDTDDKKWWTKVAIGTVNVSSSPDLTVGEPLVKLASGCNLDTDVDDIAVTVNNVATAHKLYRATDGNLYIKVASVTLDDSSVAYYATVKDAADAALAAVAAGTLTGPATFAIVDSDAPTSLVGWDYSDGTFTKNSNVAYNATKDVAYTTLQAAVTASSSGDTLKLVTANSETAVDTTGKDFIFDENGYVFSGTWTGSGRIVLSAVPDTTTWSSARFVADGWTGTVALDWANIVSEGDIVAIVNAYGIAASSVEVGPNGSASGYFNGDLVPNFRISGSVEAKNGSSTTQRDMGTVSGSGTLVFTSYDGGYGQTTNYKITDLNDWNGTLTVNSPKVTVENINSGSGDVKFNVTPQAVPTFASDWRGTFIIGWNPSADDTQVLFSQYGVAGSTVAITGMTAGYLSTRGNTESLIQQNSVPATVRLDGNVKVTNGWQSDLPAEGSWPSATASDNGARQVIFSRLSGSGDFWCAYTGDKWTPTINQHFVIQSLDGSYSGTLKIGKWFAVKLSAVDFTAEPAQNTKLIKIEVDNTEGAKGTFRNSANMNITQTGGLVDVTVNGTPSDTKLFLGDGGLYVAVASVTVDNVTTHYPTLEAAMTAAGNSPATITLLVDVTKDIALAYGQVLDVGATTYTGTVSAADSSAKIVEDGTTYKVVYGTIFSVW